MERKRRGAWYTPDDLVAMVVDAVVTADAVNRCINSGRAVRILDPACGDGRFLLAAGQRVVELGGAVHLVGVDIDHGAAAAARQSLDVMTGTGGSSLIETVDVLHGDALEIDWSQSTHAESFDLVIGNPPFLSQMAAATTRGGSSRRGGGPYADAAVEFLALAAELVDPAGGRVAFVLPQSLLSARDARPIREIYDRSAELIWSWWTGERVFDAQVLTCALGFEFGSVLPTAGHSSWAQVVTSRRGIPQVPPVIDEQCAGTLGDRARLNANFRDEYYGMIPAVGDHDDGPKLMTSGLIDPGRSLWGRRPITFAKTQFDRPRLDLSELDAKMLRWARDRMVPKVLIANQTKIIEAVADPNGSSLPGVPVVSAYPLGTDQSGRDAVRTTWEIAAVLTSPIASVWAWHRSAGSGLSADAIRLGPVLLADLPWPAGDLDAAVAALQRGDVRTCAGTVHHAYGLDLDGASHDELMRWWVASLDRIEARQPAVDCSVAPSATVSDAPECAS